MKISKPASLFPLVMALLFELATITHLCAKPDALRASDKPPIEDGRDENTRFIPAWSSWQRDVAQFDAMLQRFVETADIPEQQEFKRRHESESDWVEVITDGYGGVVDFNAAKGTVQDEANNLIGSGGPYIEWEFEVAGDTRINYDKSTRIVPKIDRIAKAGQAKGDQFRFFISLSETSAGPFKAGDQVRLKASIDDFSRFKKHYDKATGLVVIYHLEDSPNPVFDLRLGKAEITLVSADRGNPATSPQSKPEGNSKTKPEPEQHPE